MARTKIAKKTVQYPTSKARSTLIKAKVDEHDTALDAIEAKTNLMKAPTTRSGAGAVAITADTCLFTSTSAGNALTIADGSFAGQLLRIVHIVKGSSGTGVITQTTGAKLTAAISTITLSDLYASVSLQWSGTLWNVVSNDGATIA